MSERKQITLFIIATRKYSVFVQPLIDDVKKHFLIRHDVTVELFTDNISTYEGDDRVKINQTLIVSYKFPYASMYRYKIFTSKTYDCDFMYYIDADMKICEEVGEEIFGDVVAVRHPGFFARGGGSWETNEKSCCYTIPENRTKYWAGGFNGGGKEFYRLMIFMRNLIDADERAGVIPIWHDETALNFVLSFHKNITELNPSYCMVQQPHLQRSWGIDNLPAKIIALEKIHNEIRN